MAQLLAFPLGQAWAKFVPDYRFKFFGTEHSLNPGHFNKKEHMLVGNPSLYYNAGCDEQYLELVFHLYYAADDNESTHDAGDTY